MDTSKEFIKMCEKAEKIQKLRYPDFFAGDWYISLNGYPFVMGSVLPLDMDLHRRGEVWLPRQDQLQEMLSWNGVHSVIRLEEEFHKFFTSNYMPHNKPYGYFPSMEQLWLAFVMKEKYSKQWSGTEWKKEKEKRG